MSGYSRSPDHIPSKEELEGVMDSVRKGTLSPTGRTLTAEDIPSEVDEEIEEDDEDDDREIVSVEHFKCSVNRLMNKLTKNRNARKEAKKAKRRQRK